ncbi:non-ribosomal peptide synthetase [Paenibacillus sambharensis]|uniref:Non-ribosomal peptide synthetase n=1 Tax=Paenibacillus sambharensis TaxID=1803190 RepID=A0A2W1LDH1_9BACL|nr:amino acid adenylation domain-containing protein [Paenibacillus sambharensis]PZD96853.1 non-ribosomal peptide synthetase [Paenibacillus sambharensis]
MKSLFDKEERYWSGKFDADDSLSFLPYSQSSKLSAGREAAAEPGLVHRSLPGELSERIIRLAGGSDLALYMIVLAGVKSLLFKYTGQDHVLVGMPSYSADPDGTPPPHDILVIKTSVNRQTTLKTLLGGIKASIGEALEHQHLPFRKMVGPLHLDYTGDGLPVINTVASFAPIHPGPPGHRVAADTVFHFDRLHDDSIELEISFDGLRYERAFVEQAADHLVRLLSELLVQPDLELGQADMLSLDERETLLKRFNDTEAGYDREQTIHGLFEEQAELYPDNVAAVMNERQLTYRELNERANRLARKLRENGATADQLVAILAERSLDMVIGILAILKAGGAYVPVDPEYPEERIRFMIEDSGAPLLLIQQHLHEKTDFAGTRLELDDFVWGEKGTDADDALDASNLEPISGPDSLAYVIYTSGTTGRPKGTLIEHKNVVRLLFNDKNLFDFGPSDTWTLFHSFCFDFSVWEMYGALLYGGKLVIVPPLTAKNPADFLALLGREQVTILNQTPTYFYQLQREALADHPHILRVRSVIFGGEALSPLLLKGFKTKYQETKLVNMYGITETTVHVTYKEITWIEIEAAKSNIGRPIPTLKVYILDENRRPVPIGAAGEMYVAGEGLARGYLNRPDLTAEKFVDSPFAAGEKLYRSGDLAAWLPDGSIEYLGRIDHQVKIRGYRIELDEIETQLLKIGGVQEAIVLARDDANGQKQLVAYFVADRTLTVSELRSSLAQGMPGYMIPSFFVQLERMPLTPNGKTDRKALPAPEEAAAGGAEYVAPRTLLEMKLARVWQDTLGVPQVGVKDNFFELGGNSLSLMRLVQAVYDETGIEIPLNRQFHHVTVEAMALGEGDLGLGKGGDSFMRLNKAGDLNVFCFPPGSGFGIGYRELASRLDGRFVLYGIDFIDDEANYEAMLNRYVDEIVRIQPEGPYVLLGYCFGGNLTFEVAKTMEKRGYSVTDVLMVDSWIKDTLTPSDTSAKELEETLADFDEEEKELMSNPLVRERVHRKVQATLAYEAQLINSGTIPARIYELIAKDSEAFRLEHQLPSWRGATTQAYADYRLEGAHEELLELARVDETAAIIRDILEQVKRQIEAEAGVLHGS